MHVGDAVKRRLNSCVVVEGVMSRQRVLVFLVLACVTCVVLVQRSMDDTNLGSLMMRYNTQDKGGPEVLPESTNTTTTTAQPKVHLPVIKPTSPPTTVKNNPPPEPNSPQSIVVLDKTNHVEATVQVRRLPLAQTQQQLVNRQDRIQEIMKEGKVVQRRGTLDPMRTLKTIPVVNPNTVKRILIITYFRAGSSFFGDILQQNWKTFYHFEPLHSMTYDKRINDSKIPEVFELFNNVFRCNFAAAKEYMNWVKKPRNQFLFAHNLFLWVTCHSNPRTCFNPGFVNAACVRAPIHVMKVTRIHMRHVQNYLQENPGMNIKVVYLTRDPRAIVSSRWSLDWCNGTNCSDSGVLCGEMDEDIRIFNDLQRQQPRNFIKVRYEDLSLSPESKTQKLFNFLQLPFSPSVKKFLKTHTVSSRKADDKNPYSTRRNSSSMVLSWLERFNYKQIVEVQSHCQDVLQKLNHSLISSPNQLPYPNGKPKPKVTPQPHQSTAWRFNKNPLAKKYLSQKKYSANFSNNTNIEIHKSYKVVENISQKNTNSEKSQFVKKDSIT